MSYILDALKKSEREREQGAVPSLSTTPRVPFNRRSAWAGAGVGAVALACLGAAGWLASAYWFQAPPVTTDSGTTGGNVSTASAPRPAGSQAAPIDGAAATVAAGDGETGGGAAAGDPGQNVRARIRDLTVNVVSYSEVPARRFVMVDQRILRESDIVSEGVVVKRILPGGVLLTVGDRDVMVRPD